MSIKRVVDVHFWDDDKVLGTFSPEDKLFFLYLMTNPHTKQLGIYALPRQYIALEVGYALDVIDVLLDRFENGYGLIRYSYRTGEVAIKNYLRHSIVKGGKPVEDLLTKEIAEVKDLGLLQYVYDNLKSARNLNDTVTKILPLLNALGNENDNDNVNEKENENENDNDNEESSQRIVTTNRYNESLPRYVGESSDPEGYNCDEDGPLPF